MTSALALSQILSLVSRKPDDVRFLTATADCLGVSGPEAEIEVLRHLVRLTIQIESDIEFLKLDSKTTAALKQESSPFIGIRSLSQVHQNVKQAKASFLNPAHLVGLTRLHAAFAHAKPIPELSDDARSLAEDFKEALSKLQNSKMPDDLKADIELHLRQIIATLENYYFFSSKQLDHSLEALVGTLVLNPDEAEKHSKDVKPVQKVVANLLTALSSSEKYSTIARKLAENGAALLDVLK